VVAAVIAFVVGYVLGARAGEESLEELKEAWKTVSSSGEVRDLVAGGLSIARDILSRGGGLLADRMPSSERPLTRVA